eukprot:jgi/Chrzof1/6230/Cz17g16170.t1
MRAHAAQIVSVAGGPASMVHNCTCQPVGAGGLSHSPHSSTPPPGHDTHTCQHVLLQNHAGQSESWDRHSNNRLRCMEETPNLALEQWTMLRLLHSLT